MPVLGPPGHEGWPSAAFPSYLVWGLTSHGSQAPHCHMTLFSTGVPGSFGQDEKHILQRLPLLEPQFPRNLGGESKCIDWGVFRVIQNSSPNLNPSCVAC